MPHLPNQPNEEAFPGRISNIATLVPSHFVGREDELAAIDAALERSAIVVLVGSRGVGKTTLAAAYAERHRGDYRATWWIRAQSEATMRADLVALGLRLGWVGAEEEEAALSAVRERLASEGKGLLLIYNGAVDASSIEPYLPAGGSAHALVTSGAHNWGGIATPVEIRLWPKQVGADYLIARAGREGERGDAEALSEALGGLPLAHEQAAAYCNRVGISFAEFRKRFENVRALHLDPAAHWGALTVEKSVALALDEAAKAHPAAEPLIVYAALLAPEPIPLFLFSEGGEKFGEPLASQLADDGLEQAIAVLRAFALLERETISDERDPSIATDAIRLHRLVRLVAAARPEAEAAEAARRVLIEAMAEVYPRSVYNDSRTWPRARRLDALAADLVSGSTLPAGSEIAAANLLSFLGQYRQGALAAYSEARPLFDRALAIREKALGPEHPDTAGSFNNIALLLRDQGDLAGARPLFERALMISEKAFGSEHPSTATSLNNLALLLKDEGDLAGARLLCEQVLVIYEKTLGPEHSLTATSLNNLAVLLTDQGDLAAARPLAARALAIFEKALGPEDPSTAMGLNNLAFLVQAQGDLAGARPLYERALAIREKALGPEHPLTAASLTSLAGLLQAQGDLVQARPLYERALAIREKALGPEHPLTAASLNNLGALYRIEGDLAGARLLAERALSIAEKSLGPEHPSISTCLNSLALVLKDEGDLAGALPLVERALSIAEKSLGPEHPDTIGSLSNLARILRDQGEFARAEQMFLRASATGAKALGTEDPLTQRIRSHYARLLLMTDRPSEALPLAEKALAVHRAVFGPNRDWTEDSARVTADALGALGRANEAAALRAQYGLGAGQAE
jgi:tetratricopeptide (TPR) repeat protein